MKAALLCRVSTSAQSNERQVSELLAVCKQKDWDVVEIVEEKVSGASEERAGLDRIMELAASGAIQKVLVHEVSRIARKNSTSHGFLETLDSLGVSLYWHAQGVETLLPDGRRNPATSLMFSLLAELARNERETLRARIQSGMENNKLPDGSWRPGKKPGRAAGDKLSKDALLKKHADIVRYLSRDRTVREVASITNKSTTTVQRVRRAMREQVA